MANELSTHALAEMIEFYEAAAYEDMYRAAPASLGLIADESDNCVAFFAPRFDMLLFNRAMGVGLRARPSKERIEPLVNRYRESGVRNYGIQLSPAANTEATAELLSGCDLHLRDYWTKVYRSPDPPVTIETDLRIERIDKSLADTFGRVAVEGFGMPSELQPIMSANVGMQGWNHYLAWDDSIPAGVAALRVHDDIGWLGVGAVLPRFRRRGGQGALMAHRINDARELGCKWLITETGKDRADKPNPSFHNMIRTGFKVAYNRPNYMPPKQKG